MPAISQQSAPDGASPPDTGLGHDAAGIAARIEAQINLQRLSARGEASAGAADPLADLRARQWVNSHLPIGWPEMPRGLGPKLVAVLQKIARRLLRWYIIPLVEQQNEFNDAVVAALQDAYRHMERESALAASEREAAHLGLARIEAALALESGSAGSPLDSVAAERAAPPPGAFLPPQPPAAVDRYDAVLQRLLFAQQLDVDASQPLLIVGGCSGELLDRAAGLGLSVRALADLGPERSAELAPASLGGVVWVSGVWRHDAATCLHLLSALATALAPGAPLVIETIDPADAAALARYVWADPAAVRPYAPELLLEFLRWAGLASVSRLRPEPQAATSGAQSPLTAVIGYRGQD